MSVKSAFTWLEDLVTNGIGFKDVLAYDQDSIATYPHGTVATSGSTSQQIQAGAGKLAGVWVSAASSTPTIKLWANTAASGTVLIETFTPTAGQMYTFPNARYTTGLYITVSGTVSYTTFHDPTSV